MEESFKFKLLAAVGVIVFFVVGSFETLPFIVYTVSMMALIVYVGRLESAKKMLEEQQNNLIQSGDDLDARLLKGSTSTPELRWKLKAQQVPEPTLSPGRHATIDAQIKELTKEIDKRNAVLDDLEALRTYHERVSRFLDAELPEIDIKSVMENLQPTNESQLSQAHSQLVYEEALITIYAFGSLQDEFESVPQIETAVLTDSNNKPHEAKFENGDVEAIGDSLFKLLAIKRYEPLIDLTTVANNLNDAIKKGGDLSTVRTDISNIYTLMCRIQTIERMQNEVELSYTSINEEEITTATRNAIRDREPSELDGLYERLKTSIESTWDSSDLRTFTWEEFEHLIADLWKTKGYETAVTKGGSDAGIDVRAINGAKSVIIQAKHHKTGNKVGRPTVQKTLGSLTTDDAERAIVVTSAPFTQPAIIESDKAGHKMELVDRDGLVRMLSQSPIAPPNSRNNRQQTGWDSVSFEPQQTVIDALNDPACLTNNEETVITENTNTDTSTETSSIKSSDTTAEETPSVEVDGAGDSVENHPFEDYTTVDRISQSNAFGETCPVCHASNSIWRRRRDGNPIPRCKCSECETVWRQDIESGKPMWSSFGGPVSGATHTLSEWNALERDEIEADSAEPQRESN